MPTQNKMPPRKENATRKENSDPKRKCHPKIKADSKRKCHSGRTFTRNEHLSIVILKKYGARSAPLTRSARGGGSALRCPQFSRGEVVKPYGYSVRNFREGRWFSLPVNVLLPKFLIIWERPPISKKTVPDMIGGVVYDNRSANRVTIH